jgi:CheY-specific phosphatase CheX
MTASRIRRYTAIVDREDGPLIGLALELRRLGYRSIHLPRLEAWRELMTRFPKLCWAALNAELFSGAEQAVLEQTRRALPDIPILWLAPAEAQLPDDNLLRHAHTPPTISEVVSFVDCALHSRYYDELLVELLQQASERCLSSLGAFSTLREPFIKVGGARLAGLSAVISFSGKRAAGHLLVSCSASLAQAAVDHLRGSMADALDEVSATDLLAEVCNRILGMLMSYFDAVSAPVSFGLPLMLDTDDGARWDPGRTPTLALEFEGAHGPTFVELAITKLSRQATTVEPSATDYLKGPEPCLF